MNASAASLLYRDIHAPVDLLPALAASRHHNNDLVLLCSTLKYWDMTVNTVQQLAAVGLHNYIVIANREAALHAAKHRRVAAVWNSVFDQYDRLKPKHGTRDQQLCATVCNSPTQQKDEAERCAALQKLRCEDSGTARYKMHAAHRLWTLRHYYMGRLIEMRYNVLMMEADSIVLRDPFPLLRAYFGGYTAVCLHDTAMGPVMQANSGTWYVSGSRARANGPVHRLFARLAELVFEQLDAYYANPTGRGPDSSWLVDSHLINSLLLAAVLNETVQIGRWPARKSDVERSLDVSLSREERNRAEWTDEMARNATPDEFVRLPGKEIDEPPRPRRPWVAQRRWTQFGPVYGMHSVTLRDSVEPNRVERIGKAPAWMISAESDQRPLTGRVSATYWGALRPCTAIIHLVCTTWPGSDGRRAVMELWGRWHSQAIAAEVGPDYHAAPPPSSAAHIAFARPLPATSASSLAPYLRLLALLARLTGRVPVLPLVSCKLHLRGNSSAGRAPNGLPPGWLASDSFAFDAVRSRACGWALHHVRGRPLERMVCVPRIFDFCFRVFAMPTTMLAVTPKWTPDDRPQWWGQTDDDSGDVGDAPRHTMARGQPEGMEATISSAVWQLARQVNASASAKVVLIDAVASAVQDAPELLDAARFERAIGTLLPMPPLGAREMAWAECTKRMLVSGACPTIVC